MDLLDPSRLSPGHWLADASEPISHPLYAILAALLTLGLIGGIYVRLAVGEMFGGHRFKQRQAARLANAGIALCLLGVAILLFRWQPVPVLSKRIWLLLWSAGTAALVAYSSFYYLRMYPRRLVAYEETERRRRYLPRPAAAATKPRRRSRRRR
ncbi:MAG TPA: hypothetical protein VEQ11_22580 [Chloroflexota bacterium]|nr:hypothetical protein [Chloroflexota bacterium]